jgi:NADPH-dependent curcumin reductase CurA
MSPIRNARVIFNEIPKGYPEPGKTTVYDDSPTIDLDNVKLNGGFLLKTLVLSIDPYLRGRMRPVEVKSYASAYKLNEPLTSLGVGVVIRSDLAEVRKGDHIYGEFSHQEYNVIPNLKDLRKLDDVKLPWEVYVGAAGMPGQTAFAGWKNFAKAKKNQTAFVTAGAGPVGSMVIQIAKQSGMKVIACASTPEKISFIESLGADVVYNYKEEDTGKILKREGGVDVYWDNVGGEILDLALNYSNLGARFIECGMISGYNEGFKPIKNINKVMENQISMNGFIIFLLEDPHLDEFYDTIPAKMASGEMKHREEVTRGLENVGEVILRVQKGKNKAKAVIRVADE